MCKENGHLVSLDSVVLTIIAPFVHMEIDNVDK
jgi:hypothetical protein